MFLSSLRNFGFFLRTFGSSFKSFGSSFKSVFLECFYPVKLSDTSNSFSTLIILYTSLFNFLLLSDLLSSFLSVALGSIKSMSQYFSFGLISHNFLWTFILLWTYEFFITKLARIRLFTGVKQFMFLLIAQLSKSVVTKFAWKCFFSSVNHFMVIQSVLCA